MFLTLKKFKKNKIEKIYSFEEIIEIEYKNYLNKLYYLNFFYLFI